MLWSDWKLSRKWFSQGKTAFQNQKFYDPLYFFQAANDFSWIKVTIIIWNRLLFMARIVLSCNIVAAWCVGTATVIIAKCFCILQKTTTTVWQCVWEWRILCIVCVASNGLHFYFILIKKSWATQQKHPSIFNPISMRINMHQLKTKKDENDNSCITNHVIRYWASSSDDATSNNGIGVRNILVIISFLEFTTAYSINLWRRRKKSS